MFIIVVVMFYSCMLNIVMSEVFLIDRLHFRSMFHSFYRFQKSFTSSSENEKIVRIQKMYYCDKNEKQLPWQPILLRVSFKMKSFIFPAWLRRCGYIFILFPPILLLGNTVFISMDFFHILGLTKANYRRQSHNRSLKTASGIAKIRAVLRRNATKALNLFSSVRSLQERKTSFARSESKYSVVVKQFCPRQRNRRSIFRQERRRHQSF